MPTAFGHKHAVDFDFADLRAAVRLGAWAGGKMSLAQAEHSDQLVDGAAVAVQQGRAGVEGATNTDVEARRARVAVPCLVAWLELDGPRTLPPRGSFS